MSGAEQAVRAATARLAGAGIEAPRREARLLLLYALGATPESLARDPDRRLAPAEATAFAGLVARRAARQPMSQIMGQREFWSLSFRVSAAVLTPRPDSETVIEAALCHAPPSEAPRLLDLGTGSGCLLLALLHEWPRAWGLGVDCSALALAIARANAAALGVAARAVFLQADWAAPLVGRFDVVVANPPYIARAALAELAPEVARHEPRLALDGGIDGCDAYRRLAPALPTLLAPGGVAVLEVGADQADRVAALMTAAGLSERARRRDLGGIVRCLVFGQP